MADYIVHKAIDMAKLSKARKAELASEDTWVISPKYDGCHVVFLFDNGVFVSALSRTAERVLSMDHVGRALPLHYQLPHGLVAICGEAWMPGTPFAEISGIFRRYLPQPELGFVPFDIVPYTLSPFKLGMRNGAAVGTPYATRIGALRDTFKPAYSTVIRPATIEFVGTPAQAWDFASVYATDRKASPFGHYDGAIMAMASGKYIVGAGTGGEFIKCKPLLSETVTVTGAKLAKGDKTGKNTAALSFEFNGQKQYVSTGLTQAEVDSIAANTDDWVGKRIEVEAMGLTEAGLLREPRYKGIRNDA